MLEYWFMFPIAIGIATIAMTLGIGGALLFSPIFILLFPIIGVPTLTPADAFGAALLTEVFGFASGLFGYSRRKLIDYKTGIAILVISIPAALAGTFIKRIIEDFNLGEYLNLLFGLGLWVLTLYIYLNHKKGKESPVKPKMTDPKRIIVDSENITYEYQVRNASQGRILNAIGGFAAGLISVGIGETAIATLRVRCGLPMKVAAATSVFIVTFTVLSAAVFDIALIGIESIPWSLVLFTIPGVLIGGQIGPKVASRISSKTAEKLMITVFLFFGTIMILKAFFALI